MRSQPISELDRKLTNNDFDDDYFLAIYQANICWFHPLIYMRICWFDLCYVIQNLNN